MSLLRSASLLTASLVASAACAADAGWYVGAAYSDVSADIGELSEFDAHATHDTSGFKLIAGYQALEWLALEANYNDFGKATGFIEIACIPEVECPGDFDFETRTLSIAALASVGIGPVDFFARAGISRWDTDVRFAGAPPAGHEEIDGTDPEYGLGVRVNLQALALRLEFERQDLDANHIDQLSLGATYTFGR